jgi:hypothetical protein
MTKKERDVGSNLVFALIGENQSMLNREVAPA